MQKVDKSLNTLSEQVESYYRLPHVVDNNFLITDRALAVNCTGHMLHVRGIDVSSSRHDYYCFYLTQGLVHISSPLQTDLHPGDIIIYRPETCYRYRSMECFSYYWIHFSGSGAADLLAHTGILPDHVYSPGIRDEVIQEILKIFKAFQYRDALWELEAAVSLGAFAVAIGKSIAPSSRNTDPIRKAAAYIQMHISSPLPVTELAAMSYMSVSGFSARFKRYYGMAPSEYITAMRIARASQLLLETDLSIEGIAATCGFEDPHYFSRVFRKSCGLSPRQWRQARRNTEN